MSESYDNLSFLVLRLIDSDVDTAKLLTPYLEQITIDCAFKYVYQNKPDLITFFFNKNYIPSNETIKQWIGYSITNCQLIDAPITHPFQLSFSYDDVITYCFPTSCSSFDNETFGKMELDRINTLNSFIHNKIIVIESTTRNLYHKLGQILHDTGNSYRFELFTQLFNMFSTFHTPHILGEMFESSRFIYINTHNDIHFLINIIYGQGYNPTISEESLRSMIFHSSLDDIKVLRNSPMNIHIHNELILYELFKWEKYESIYYLFNMPDPPNPSNVSFITNIIESANANAIKYFVSNHIKLKFSASTLNKMVGRISKWLNDTGHGQQYRIILRELAKVEYSRVSKILIMKQPVGYVKCLKILGVNIIDVIVDTILLNHFENVKVCGCECDICSNVDKTYKFKSCACNTHMCKTCIKSIVSQKDTISKAFEYKCPTCRTKQVLNIK
jgi:hypothetical protein